MSYQVLARKWRPRTFGEVVGQEHVLRALINALDNDRLHHAYLFSGTRGVGKTTLGRILAKSLNCEQGVSANPCGQCSACREIDEGRFVDLIEVDAASRTKVEDTRELMDNVQYAPTRGRYKVYLVDEVHMLSNHSFNALLKTLEEPPPHVKFLLATTDPQRLPVTILSRCLKFNLKSIPRERIADHLVDILDREGVAYERAGVNLIAQAADGSMRDALSLMDQAIAFGGGAVNEAEIRAMLGTIGQDRILALLEPLSAGDGAGVLQQVQALAEQGVDFTQVLAELITSLHRLALIQAVPEGAAAEDSDDQRLQALAGQLSAEDIQLYYQIALLGRRDLPLAPDPRSGFEMLALRMLAFRPVLDGGEARPPVTRPAAAPASPPAAKAAEMPPTASEPAPAPEAPVSTAAPPAASAATENDWATILNALRLTGMVKQLAVNCAWGGMENDVVTLRLARSHAQLASEQMVERLQTALQNHFGRPVRLSLQVEDSLDDTPAAEQARKDEQRQEEAVRDIESDPNVRAMQEMFDAQLDPNSIRPTD